MIDLIAAAGIGGIIGAGIMAWRTAGKVADLSYGEIGEPECLNCYDCGWVCENHRDQPWEGISSVAHACDCGGAGSPCPVCEWDMATAGIRDETERAHTRCADALTTCQRKLSAIRDLVGPTEGLRRGRLGQIAAILDGERA